MFVLDKMKNNKQVQKNENSKSGIKSKKNENDENKRIF